MRCAAGQAHWQNGVAERHGAAWKAVYDKVVLDREALLEEVQDVVAIVNQAKNTTRNRSGYSPRQWVFGSSGAWDDDDGAQDFDLATPNVKFARPSSLRHRAKAFFATRSRSFFAQSSPWPSCSRCSEKIGKRTSFKAGCRPRSGPEAGGRSGT